MIQAEMQQAAKEQKMSLDGALLAVQVGILILIEVFFYNIKLIIYSKLPKCKRTEQQLPFCPLLQLFKVYWNNWFVKAVGARHSKRYKSFSFQTRTVFLTINFYLN